MKKNCPKSVLKHNLRLEQAYILAKAKAELSVRPFAATICHVDKRCIAKYKHSLFTNIERPSQKIDS